MKIQKDIENRLMKATIAILLLGLTQTLVFGQNKVGRIDSLFTRLYKAGKFNGNVLIAERDSVIYKKSFGNSNKSTKENLNENTIFELASVSKTFTSMAVMILKDRGKLKLDDKVSKYLPGLSYYDNISIRNLLNHTSGLPDYLALMNATWDKTKIATNRDVIRTLIKYHPAELFKPDTKEEYSNTGYVLLASIIENVSGQTYSDFLGTEIFKPLHMDRTLVYHRRLSNKKINNYALGYLNVNGKFVLPDNDSRTGFVIWSDGVTGDGTVNSTIDDLYKWSRALETNRLVSEQSWKEIFSNGVLQDGELTKHGFGWRVLETEPFGKIARHSGAWPGYLNFLERDLDSGKTIIILQNHYNGVMPKQAVRNILYNMPLPKTMKQLYNEGKTVDEIIFLLKNPVSKYLIDNFYEDGINEFGYQLMAQKKYPEALKIFHYNTIEYPKSSNAFDSFGECLFKMGDKQKAREAYKSALELNPKNKNAEQILSKFDKTGETNG
jgi:CubicO group peptidase (beta-lactamase class C family)